MNRRENWNLGSDVVKTLIISDNQWFDYPERIGSDNQINISRLISFLGGARSMLLTPTTTTDVKSKTRDLGQRDPKLSRLGRGTRK